MTDIRKALEAAVTELEILHGPHFMFDVHAHYKTGELLWDTDDCSFREGGVIASFSTKENLKSVCLHQYLQPLTKLADAAVSGAGYGVGIVPVTFGKHEEDVPWEPDFERAFMLPLDDGCLSPAIDKARAALSLELESESDG